VLTAPYGHAGAYASLEGVIRHHLDPVAALMNYDPVQALLVDLRGADDWRVLNNAAEMIAIAAANELAPMSLPDAAIADLVAFMNALTDPQSEAGRLGVPDRVPSGLPVD
jgi:cytochrome c peroxidase